ncbi:MAG: bifunctional UDP-N-acetylglucosamine diphosphorylase/glucosamine-1-phosphate N-acetyltransferase GlmU [Saezia sp.]
MNLNIVIMAAGRGTRMKSTNPKALQVLGGKPMLLRIMDTVSTLQPHSVVVVTGFGAEQVAANVQAHELGAKASCVLQEPQLGTGHAVQQAVPLLPDDGVTVILNSDSPLIEAATIGQLVEASAGQHLALLTVCLDNPKGYGRILRSADGKVIGIVEEKDATDAQRAIKEVNTGFMAVPTQHLKKWLARLDNKNAQQEYYLTDIIAMAVADGVNVAGIETTDEVQVTGVNSPAQLAALERAYQWRQAETLMDAGVRLADPARIDIRGELQCGQDVEIDVSCIFEGVVKLGNNVRIGAHCVIGNAVIDDGAVIHPFTHIAGETKEGQGVQVGAGALIGPYARLRPGAQLAAGVHVGNFVEIKNSTLAAGAKANHLSYIGDTTVGEKTNIGAGTITANYNGVDKFRTTIGAEVRVGSNAVLVAPVTLGDRSTVAAGSVITKDVPENNLGLARGHQMNVANWKRPEKK